MAIYAILGIGQTFVILTAGIDLSVGSIVGVSGMVAGAMLTNGIHVGWLGLTIYPNAIETILIALAVGVGIGLISGLLITQLGVAPFIATLGTLYIARGAALLISNGRTFPNLVGIRRPRQPGFPDPRRRRAPRHSAVDLRHGGLRAGRRLRRRRGRRSAATSMPSAATSAPRRCRACAST